MTSRPYILYLWWWCLNIVASIDRWGETNMSSLRLGGGHTITRNIFSEYGFRIIDTMNYIWYDMNHTYSIRS